MLGWFGRKRSPVPPEPSRNAGRVFAEYHQFHLLDGPDAPFDVETENWNSEKTARGYAGNPRFRMIGTQSQYQEHWVTLESNKHAPEIEGFERIVRFDFECRSGVAQIWETAGAMPLFGIAVTPGRYDVHVCAANIGVEPEVAGPDGQWPKLSDAELAARTDLEHYRIVLTPSSPA